MSKRVISILIGTCASLALSGCGANSLTLTPVTDVFDFDLLNDLTFTFDDSIGEFSAMQGANIADGDYTVSDNTLTLKKEYLVDLKPGEYRLAFLTSLGAANVDFTVLDKNNENRLINGSFETGTFLGWESQTVFKGESALQAFAAQALVANGVIPSSTTLTYGGSGGFVYGIPDLTSRTAWEESMGMLTSRSFTLAGSGHVTFRLGAAKNADLTYLSFVNAETNQEIARYGNPEFDLTTGEYHGENLVQYDADLSEHLGEKLFVRAVDLGGRSWDFLTLDDIETYVTEVPESAIEAVNILPTFEQAYAPNQVINGNFANGLQGWAISEQAGWQNALGLYDAFRVPAGFLRSDLGGDAARGLIRSSLFRVDGSGFMSLSLGAAQGARFDKDTFVSIRHAETNEEIFRFANSRHNGNTMVPYFVDLSKYLNDILYLEIVDNATGSYDTIFVDDIVTYYASRPNVDFGDMAVNLNF